jgi:predicted amino acid-binding ACT domain protein
MASVAAKVVTKATTWSKIKNVPIQYPFAFGFFLSGFKTSGSDLLVQKVVEQREEIDWRRNAAFAAFGFFYLGGVQYGLYVPIFGRMFPGTIAFAAKPLSAKLKDAKGMFQVGAQVFIDQCVHHPLMYFPVFYCTKELVMSDKPDVVRVLNEYRVNMKEDLLALWKIWVPATIFNFAFMPMWGRIPCVAATSAVWTMVLSSMRGGDVSNAADMAGGAVTGATFDIMEEGLGNIFTQPVELARDKHHMVISASGLDKVGWTAQMSRAVAEAGGNVTHSKMVRLGTEFIIVMHVAVEPENQRKLTKALKENENLKELHIHMNSIARRKTGTFQPPLVGFRLRCVGEDK